MRNGKGAMMRKRLVRTVHRQSAKLALVGIMLGTSLSAAATNSRKVMVLSISEAGHQQEGLRAEVGQLVQRAGGLLTDSSSLPTARRSCEEPTCLSALAKENDVELIVAARIERRPRHERMVDMWIYDASSGRDQSVSDLCDARDLKDCLSAMAGKLLGPLLDPSAQPAVKPVAPAAPKPAPAAVVSMRPIAPTGIPTWRTGLGISLGLLTIGALATAIGAHAKNGQEEIRSIDGVDKRGTLQTMPLYGAGYAVAGAAALSAGLTFFWPSTPSQEVRK